jgi:hypothetical protein
LPKGRRAKGKRTTRWRREGGRQGGTNFTVMMEVDSERPIKCFMCKRKEGKEEGKKEEEEEGGEEGKEGSTFFCR